MVAKTTLLNLLTGKLQCTDGDVKRNFEAPHSAYIIST